MRFKFLKAALLFLILSGASILVLNAWTPAPMAEPPITRVFTDPSSIVAPSVGLSFTVNINVSDVVDLYAWQFGLTFNPDVLVCTEFYEGELMKRQTEPTLFLEHWKDMNNTLGVIYFRGCCILGPHPGVDGSGQLAYVTFKSVGVGVSNFHLTDAYLIDSGLECIEFEVVESFTVQEYALNYDVVIVNNLTGVSSPVDPPMSGTFDCSFDRDGKEISFNVASAKDWFVTMTIPRALLRCGDPYEWTVEVDGAPVSYAASANETHTSLYFVHTNGSSSIGITGLEVVHNPCDLNKDSKVNIYDVVILVGAYGCRVGDFNWNAAADLVAPWGIVDIFDALAICDHYGETY